MIEIVTTGEGNAIVEPVTVGEFKAWADIERDDEDGALAEFVSTARGWIENEIDQALALVTYRETFPYFPLSNVFNVSKTPVVEIKSLKYRDAENLLQTYDAANYTLVNSGGFNGALLVGGSFWPWTYQVPDAVEIIYRAGMDAAQVPGALKGAIKALATWLYEHRHDSETKEELPPHVRRMIGPERKLGV